MIYNNFTNKRKFLKMNENEINELIEKLNEQKSKTTIEKWRIGKEIPIALIIVILFQTFGGIWWAATINAKIDSLNDQIVYLQSEKYTKLDASKDLATINVKIDELNRRVTNLENNHKN